MIISKNIPPKNHNFSNEDFSKSLPFTKESFLVPECSDAEKELRKSKCHQKMEVMDNWHVTSFFQNTMNR